MLVLAVGLCLYSVFYPKTHVDECTPIDRLSNNCVSAGTRCSPELRGNGLPVIGPTNPIKNYDHTRC